MKKRLFYISYIFFGHALFTSIVLGIAISIYHLGVRHYYFILFCILLVLAFLPVLNFYYSLFDRYFPDENETFFDTIDSVLSVNSLDEFLERRFTRILSQMSVKVGMFFLYDREKDEYNIYYQKDKKSRILKNANIDRNNIILKIINSAEDIIIKNRLNDSINFEKNLLEEMKKINAGVIVPIYYNDIYQGLMVLEDRRRRFSSEEVSILKIFASKIGILSINNQLWKEEVRKKELEKEYELGLKVRSKFLPLKELRVGGFDCSVYFESHSTGYNFFYDLFQHEKSIMLAAYSITESISGTGIYMPAINALLQSYARLNYSAGDTITKLKKVLGAKALIDGELKIFQGLLYQDGFIEFFCEKYSFPFIFDSTTNRLVQLTKNSNKSEKFLLKKDDIFILGDKENSEIFSENLQYFESTLKKYKESSLDYISGSMNKLIIELSHHKENSFFALVRRGEVDEKQINNN